jgi:hypothetical protein
MPELSHIGDLRLPYHLDEQKKGNGIGVGPEYYRHLHSHADNQQLIKGVSKTDINTQFQMRCQHNFFSILLFSTYVLRRKMRHRKT